ETACQFQIRQWKRVRIGRCVFGHSGVGRSDGAIEKIGTDQYRSHHLLDACIKPAWSLLTGFKVRHEGVDVLFCDGTAETPARQVFDNAPGATPLGFSSWLRASKPSRFALRLANKNAFAARSFRDARRVEGPDDGDAVDHSRSS